MGAFNFWDNSKFKRAVRDRCCEMQRYRCAYCLCCIRDGATLDHLKPQSKWGATSYENCVASCWRCNNERGNRSEWKQYKRVKLERWSVRAQVARRELA